MYTSRIRYPESPMKKPVLYILHFAGGSCYSFLFMTGVLTNFHPVFLELPGRGRRMNEPLLKDFDAAARDIFNQIAGMQGKGDFIIYGHSMGAYLALRVTGLLERSGLPPVCLIVSGNAGPGMQDHHSIYRLERDMFMEKLEGLGGIPAELRENRELFDFFEPILRADFEIAERNSAVSDDPVQAPLFAMMGSLEEKADKISNWGRFTRSAFRYEILEGDHFFIYKHPERIAGIITDCYTAVGLVHQG